MKENTREFSVIKQRILKYLEYKGISKYECYKQTGMANGILSQMNGISEDNLLKFIFNNRDISLNWLLYGEGEMIEIEHSHHQQINDISKESKYYDFYIEQKTENRALIEEIGALKERISQLNLEKLPGKDAHHVSTGSHSTQKTATAPYVGVHSRKKSK